jgi:hypothetical protein
MSQPRVLQLMIELPLIMLLVGCRTTAPSLVSEASAPTSALGPATAVLSPEPPPPTPLPSPTIIPPEPPTATPTPIPIPPTPVKVNQSTSTPEPFLTPTVTVTPPAEPTPSLMLAEQMAYISGSSYAVIESSILDAWSKCCLSFSPDGQKITFGYHTATDQKIYVQNIDGSGLKEISSLTMYHGDGPFPDPVWSPDGRHIAFVHFYGMYVVEADGANLTRLEPEGFDPAWSPDGQSLAFTVLFEQGLAIGVMNPDGSDFRQLTNFEAYDQRPAWSPDAQTIAFVSDRDGNREIYLMHNDGSDQRRLTYNEAQDWGPVFSPDGRYIVFSSDRDGHNGIYVMNSDGAEQRWLMASDMPQRWVPDTTRIRFVEDVQEAPPLPEEISQALAFTLAQQFRVNPDEIELVSWQQTTWPNGCLGIDRRQPCPPGETPGYRLRLKIKGVPYEFRSPAADPLNLRLAVGPAVDIEETALLWEGEPALFAGAEEGSCLSFTLSAAGQGSLGACDGPQRAVELTGEQFARLELWHDWLLRFAYFEADTPYGRVVFQAHSPETASPAWQRALAAWAKLAALELNDGRSGASWGAALAWQQPHPDRPGYCQFLSVQTYGWAYASTALCEGGDPENLGQGWIDTTQWEQFDDWFYQRTPLTTERLSFFGVGSTELSEADRAALEQWAEIVYAKLAGAASEPSPEKTYVYIGTQPYPLPEQVSFTYQGLATGITSEFQPARPYVSGPTGPAPDLAYPTHLRFYFLDAPPAGALVTLGGRPQLRIYPVNDYRLLYWHEGLQAGTPGHIINQTIDRLQAMLVDRPETGEGDLPFLPPQHNSQVFKAQLKYLDFQDGAGIRFITQHAIGGPINNQDIFYTFQGITTDDQYYVTLFYPISTTALAEFSRDDTFETLADFQTHVQDTTQRLDALSPEDFAPDLSMLDALIQSLQIRSTP